MDSSSAGSKRSITECMADALAKSLGVELSDGLGAQERFKIAGVRYRGIISPGAWLDLGLEYKNDEGFGFGHIFQCRLSFISVDKCDRNLSYTIACGTVVETLRFQLAHPRLSTSGCRYHSYFRDHMLEHCCCCSPGRVDTAEEEVLL